MSVETELYFSAIRTVLGPVDIRNLGDYEHVTDSGILSQVLDDNGYPISTETMTSVKSVFLEELGQHIENAGAFPVVDGAIRFFDSARESTDCRVAVATGSWRESALLKLESAGFNIDGIPVVTSDDATSRVAIMQLALKKAGGDLESATYFGDAEWDRRACNSLGWRFVAVGKGLGGIESFDDVEL